MSLQSLQQLTGENYVFYYGATVFTSVGISDSFVTQIILGSVNFVCTFGGLYVMEKVCRFAIHTFVRKDVDSRTNKIVWASRPSYSWRHLAVSMAPCVCHSRNRQGSIDGQDYW